MIVFRINEDLKPSYILTRGYSEKKNIDEVFVSLTFEEREDYIEDILEDDDFDDEDFLNNDIEETLPIAEEEKIFIKKDNIELLIAEKISLMTFKQGIKNNASLEEAKSALLSLLVPLSINDEIKEEIAYYLIDDDDFKESLIEKLLEEDFLSDIAQDIKDLKNSFETFKKTQVFDKLNTDYDDINNECIKQSEFLEKRERYKESFRPKKDAEESDNLELPMAIKSRFEKTDENLKQIHKENVALGYAVGMLNESVEKIQKDLTLVMNNEVAKEETINPYVDILNNLENDGEEIEKSFLYESMNYSTFEFLKEDKCLFIDDADSKYLYLNMLKATSPIYCESEFIKLLSLDSYKIDIEISKNKYISMPVFLKILERGNADCIKNLLLNPSLRGLSGENQVIFFQELLRDCNNKNIFKINFFNSSFWLKDESLIFLSDNPDKEIRRLLLSDNVKTKDVFLALSRDEDNKIKKKAIYILKKRYQIYVDKKGNIYNKKDSILGTFLVILGTTFIFLLGVILYESNIKKYIHTIALDAPILKERSSAIKFKLKNATDLYVYKGDLSLDRLQLKYLSPSKEAKNLTSNEYAFKISKKAEDGTIWVNLYETNLWIDMNDIEIFQSYPNEEKDKN